MVEVQLGAYLFLLFYSGLSSVGIVYSFWRGGVEYEVRSASAHKLIYQDVDYICCNYINIMAYT